jgi:RND family efflux transporter MFP subunit
VKTASHISLVMLLTVLCVGCKQDPPVDNSIRPVRAVKLYDKASIDGGSLPGQASAVEEVNLAFRVSGPLIELPINMGDEVKKGDVVAQIDPTDFRVAVDDATANLERAERELDAMRVARPEEIRVAEEDVNAAKASVARAQADHNRNIGLINSNAISQREFDLTEAIIEVEKAGLQSAVEKLSQLKAGARPEDIAAQQAEIRSLKASLENAQNQLRYTTLQAPFDATITAIFVDNYQGVQKGKMIARLVDKSSIEFTINVPESGIPLVPYVRDLGCIFDAFPDKQFTAMIKEVGFEASRTTRTYPVTLSIEQQYEAEGILILPGMAGRLTGRIELPEGSLDKGIEVPETAIFSDSGNQFVWIVDESANTVNRMQVTPGELTQHGIRVPEHRPGQVVATAGVHSLTEGQQVRILDAAETRN